MSHLTITDQQTNKSTTLCIERSQRHAEIIGSDLTSIERLTEIAHAQGVTDVYIVLTLQGPVHELVAKGYKQIPDALVMVHHGKAT